MRPIICIIITSIISAIFVHNYYLRGYVFMQYDIGSYVQLRVKTFGEIQT